MSLFGELDVDIAAADDNPFEVPAGIYSGFVSDVEVKESQKGNQGLMITYTVGPDDAEYAGRTIGEWKNLPVPGDAKAAQAASFLKLRLLSLGVPEDKINSIEADDLIGTAVVFTVADGKDGYKNIRKVTLDEGSPVDDVTSFLNS